MTSVVPEPEDRLIALCRAMAEKGPPIVEAFAGWCLARLYHYGIDEDIDAPHSHARVAIADARSCGNNVERAAKELFSAAVYLWVVAREAGDYDETERQIAKAIELIEGTP